MIRVLTVKKVNKIKNLIEKLRLENKTLKQERNLLADYASEIGSCALDTDVVISESIKELISLTYKLKMAKSKPNGE